MTAFDYPSLLHSNGLRTTQQRLKVLDCFQKDNYALTYHDIFTIVGNEIDRVSLYRILTAFTEKSILYCVSDAHGNRYYMFNRCYLSKDAFFALVKCEHCNKISALPELPDAYLQLLKKHHIRPQVMFSGLCENCCSD